MSGCRALTEAEVAVISRSFGGRYAARDRALFLLGVRTGFRISELLSLRVGDVWQGGRVVDVLTVERRYIKRKTEGRTVPLHVIAKTALLDWITRMPPGCGPQTYLFPSRKGDNRPLQRLQAWQILHEAYVSNQLHGRLGTHSMRKTFAQRLYAKTRDIVKVQKALGHVEISSTGKYLDSVNTDELYADILSL